MSPSWRKPFGMLLILVIIVAWAGAVATLVEAVPALDNFVTYLVAGIAWIWILPLRRLLRWMELGVWK